MFQTLYEAADAIRQKKTTPLDLVEACLANIERCEGQVRAWVLVDGEYARAEARRLGDELGKGRYRGPLHGIPLAVKDIFDVFDWPTAAGSARWAGSVARQDAAVVDNLRRAGAVFLGKTVTTQYASFDPPETRNPWNLERTPGGSSSGSAAAVACLMCLGALGSQTGGSITRPAAYCGIAGCKPTFGKLPTAGVVPLAPSMDHPGPLGRCVRDLAILLQGMGGGSTAGAFASSTDNLASIFLEPLPPPRLGRLRGLFEDKAEPCMRSLIEDVAEKLAAHGAIVTEHGLPAAFCEVIGRHRTVMAVEAAAFHEPRLRRHPDDYAPKIRALLEEGLSCSAPEYARCKEHQHRLQEEMATCLVGVDALLTPAATGPAPAADTTGDPEFNSPWSYTGLPTVSFPTGHFADGLPLAIQLVGKPFGEAELLAAAAWCERVLAVRPLNPAAMA